MTPRLEISQGQEQKQLQILDARQLQSLGIMQKPLQELREEIRAELVSNPVLEELAPTSGGLPESSGGAAPDEDAGDTGNDRTPDDYTADIDRYESALDGNGGDGTDASDRHERFIESLADRPSVTGRLLGQLRAEGLPEAVLRAGEYLLGSLDADGRTDLSEDDLARAAGVSPGEAREALRIVRSLDFAPARTDDSDIAFLVPEVAILKAPGGGYTAELLPGALPRLRIVRLYRNLAAARETDPATRKYLAEKLRSGEFWIDSLARRNETVLKIAREIARVQTPFFEHGLARLRPMTLAEMGGLVGLHETTVGRAIDNKSALTPQGTCPLRLFFTHGVRRSAPARTDTAVGTGAGETDETVSTLAVRAAIRQLVRDENPKHPLSDQALAEALRGRGMPVARRTIAKYREQLGIAPSHQRRTDSNR